MGMGAAAERGRSGVLLVYVRRLRRSPTPPSPSLCFPLPTHLEDVECGQVDSNEHRDIDCRLPAQRHEPRHVGQLGRPRQGGEPLGTAEDALEDIDLRQGREADRKRGGQTSGPAPRVPATEIDCARLPAWKSGGLGVCHRAVTAGRGGGSLLRATLHSTKPHAPTTRVDKSRTLGSVYIVGGQTVWGTRWRAPGTNTGRLPNTLRRIGRRPGCAASPPG